MVTTDAPARVPTSELSDGDLLREERQRLKMTQPEFATYLNEVLRRNYDAAAISRFENGRAPLPKPLLGWLTARRMGAETQRTVSGNRVVAIANQKGGVGKTTTAVNLAMALAFAGRRVILIDCDPQASATAHLGYEWPELEARESTLFWAFRKRPLTSLLVDAGPIKLVPSGLALATIEMELVAQPFGPTALQERLPPLLEAADHIILDCPPQLGQLTVNALAAADLVLIPSRTDGLDVLGIPALLDNTIARLQQKVNTGLRVLGILPTQHNGSVQATRILDQIRAAFGARFKVYDPIPYSQRYSTAAAQGRAALQGPDAAPGADIYLQIAEDVINAAR